MREVVYAWGGFLEKFSCAVAEELVDADLDFEGCVPVCGIHVQVGG